MLKPIHTALSLSMASMIFSAYLALSTTVEYDRPVLLLPFLFFAIMPVAEWADTRFPNYRRLTTLVTLCYTLAIPILWIRIGLFPTVIALVIYIQAYKLFHAKTERDYHHIFLMSFFLLVTACVLSPDAAIALPLLLFLASAVWAFFALEVRSEVGRVPVLVEADIVPLDAQRVTANTLGSRRKFDFGLFVSSMAITLACVLMTVLFFVATPRMEAGVLGGNSLATAPTVTGVSETIDLAQSGEIQRDTSPVMRAQFPDEPGGKYDSPLYWRITSLDRYNGTGWESQSDPTWVNDDTPAPRYLMTPGIIERNSSRGEGARHVRQTIYLDRVTENGVPVLRSAVRVNSANVRLKFDRRKGDGTVQLAQNNRDSLLYEVLSEVEEPTPDELRQEERARGNDYGDMNPTHYQRLTYTGDLDPRTRELAQSVTESGTYAIDKVKAIEDYLGRGPNFFYTLDIVVDEQHPVDYFLHVSRKGHCELFASAMALMVRSLGIPARVVTGYRGGEWNADDKSYTIRADMAHLWVEVYFVNKGWVTFDPSPPEDFSAFSTRSQLQQALFRNLLKSKMMWYQHVVGYHNELGIGGMGDLTSKLLGWLRSPDPMAGMKAARRDLLTGLNVFNLVVFTFLVIALLSYFVRRRGGAHGSGRRRYVLSRDQVRAIRLFLRARRAVRDLIRQPAEKTAEELIEDLRAIDSPTSNAAVDALQTYSRVRFGGRSLNRERFLELRRALKT